MQKLIIAGTVTKPAELRRSASGGDPALNFTVVVDNGKDASGNRRDGTFYECTIWGKRGEAVESHITKGKKLTVFGRPTARVYDGKAYLGMSVDDFTFQGGGEHSQQDRQQDHGGDAGRQAPAGYGAGGGPNSGGRQDDFDEIPFIMEWR